MTSRFVDIREIDLADLEIGKAQVRLRDVGKDIDELAASIAKSGLLEPIVVAPGSAEGKFEIITGQRRFLAHQKLKAKTILAGILPESVDELEAKVISLTENLVRRDLNSKDLIDVCTALYKKYGSIKSVAEETGLPANKVANYVKYDQLSPTLKGLVDSGEVKITTALQAQKASTLLGGPDDEAAAKLAREMDAMSGAQQKKIREEVSANPSKGVEDVIEEAKGGGRITQVIISLTASSHSALQNYSKDVELGTIGDAAQDLIERGLTDEGYLTDSDSEA